MFSTILLLGGIVVTMKAVHAILYRFFHHRTNLHDLPLEVLSEVASYLKFSDILSLQQTSKKLRESTEARVVWLALAKDYSARHFHLYRPESGALDDLKTDELRQWIGRRLIVDQIWRTCNAQPRVRTLHENRDIVLKLVPGGRWLLVGYDTGHVCYYDLNSEDLNCFSLILPSKDIRGAYQQVHGLEIHVEADTPVLQFKVAMRGIESLTSAEIEWLHVWQVRLKGDNSLTAEWLVSVPTFFNYGNPQPLALERDMVARTMSPGRGFIWVEIYWWRQCSLTRVLRTLFPIACDPDNIFLIGNDRALCIKPAVVVELYDFPEPEYIDAEENLVPHQVTATREPIWSHAFSTGGAMYCSPLYWDGTTYRLVISTNQGVWGLSCPASKKDAPSIIQLSPFNNQFGICAPGFCKAYALYGKDKTGVRLGYTWEDRKEDNLGMTYTNGEPKHAPLFGEYPAFDEESGRFVYLNKNDIMVIDFH